MTDAVKLKDSDLGRLAAAVHAAAGITLGPEKRTMIEARLAKLARRTQRPLADLLAEIDHDREGEAMANLLDVLTTNYTSFFREPQHFGWLAETWLPAAIAARRSTEVWCAASATGEEPYSLVMCLHEAAARLGLGAPSSIRATDISRRALEVAAAGIYPATHVDTMDRGRLRKWFQRGVGEQAGWVRVKRELASSVSFSRHNLLDEPPFQGLGLIFLRNVLIYFDDATQTQVLARMHQALAPGGFLVIGHAENVGRLRHGFTMHGHTVLERPR
jgi:chemotaxis protein methyltransferase CheR